MAALKAGQAGGGDKRGMQSAALLVVRKNGGYLGANDRYIDIRVYDAADPIAELERLLRAAQAALLPERAGGPGADHARDRAAAGADPARASRSASRRSGWRGRRARPTPTFLEALENFMYWENYDVRVRMDGKIDRVVLEDILGPPETTSMNGDHLLRPPPRALHALLHRDVGAVQLLRHAGVPHPLHDRAGRRRRARLRRPARGPVYGTYTGASWALPIFGGMIADRFLGQYRQRAARRHHHRARPLHARLQALPFFYAGLALIVSAPASSSPTSAPSSARCTSRTTRAATPASRSSTWASTSAPSSRRSSPGWLAQKVDWHSASPAPASA